MIFFKTKIKFENEEWQEHCKEKDYLQNMTGEIQNESCTYNEKLAGRAYFFPFKITKNTLEMGMIMQVPTDFAGYMNEVLGFTGIDPDEMDLDEVTFETMYGMLHTAEREGFIEDEDDALGMVGLEDLASLRIRHNYRESLLENSTRKELYSSAERLMAEDTLIPELDRIYAGTKNPKVFAHPVHYLVETDDKSTRKGLYTTILRALRENERIFCQRYAYTNLNPGYNDVINYLDKIYKSCTFGAVVLRFSAEDDEEDDTASSTRQTVECLAEVVKHYQNNVLTIICLPRECTELKDLLREYLGGISFVEIKNDDAKAEQAEKYLHLCAKDKHIRTDKKLFSRLDGDRSYSITELQDIFDEWYATKIKTTVYPQYKEITAEKVQKAKEKPKGSAYSELCRMTGLSQAKKVMDQALAYDKAKKLFADRGMKDDKMTMHMVFTGNPGTAKTTVARLFARIFRENGIVSTGKMVEVGRGDLVGKYVGWTAPIIQKKFKEASGGVLFIDEAYSLVDDRNGSFGDEAINTIVQEMENHRDDVVVIFAGYPDEMNRFLEKNPGLKSRISFHVNFPDYSSEELVEISELLAEKKGMKISAGAREKLGTMFEAARAEHDFGNGRYARNVIEKAKMLHGQRLILMDYDKVTDKDIVTIDADDIEMPEFKKKKANLGFCME